MTKKPELIDLVINALLTEMEDIVEIAKRVREQARVIVQERRKDKNT